MTRFSGVLTASHPRPRILFSPPPFRGCENVRMRTPRSTLRVLLAGQLTGSTKPVDRLPCSTTNGSLPGLCATLSRFRATRRSPYQTGANRTAQRLEKWLTHLPFRCGARAGDQSLTARKVASKHHFVIDQGGCIYSDQSGGRLLGTRIYRKLEIRPVTRPGYTLGHQ